MKPIFKNRQNETFIIKSEKTIDRNIWVSRSVAVVCHVWFRVDGVYYVLLGKRGPRGDKPGLINIPCGYLDWDENLQEAMFREVWEETGLDLSKYNLKNPELRKILNDSYVTLNYTEQPWHVYSSPDENRQNVAMHTAIVINLGSIQTLPELTIDNCEEGESTEAFWLPYHKAIEIPSENWAFNHNKKLMEFNDFLCTNYIKI